MERLKIYEAIVVEGKYDKNALMQIVDAPILETNGFGIFRNAEQMQLLRSIAAARGLIVLTDSDGAGFVIRNKIKSMIPREHLKHAYIPDIYGRERRKKIPGKEGKLGVEGMSRDIILNALITAGATTGKQTVQSSSSISRQDYFELGLSGGSRASELRDQLKKKLGLPEKMSSTALFQALCLLLSREELFALMNTIGE